MGDSLFEIIAPRQWSETCLDALERIQRQKGGANFRLTGLQKESLRAPAFWGGWTEEDRFRGRNLIIQGATSAGKTLVSEMNILDTLSHRRKVLILVPLKTMVKERFYQLREDLGDAFRVYASSGDFLDNDLNLIRGEFDVAVLVYEKLFAMLCQDQCRILNGCGLIVVDELSMLSAQARGPKLEISLEKAKQQEEPARIICLTTLDCDTRFIERWLATTDPETGEPVPAQTISCPLRPVGLDEYIVTLDGEYTCRHIPGENETQPPVASPYEAFSTPLLCSGKKLRDDQKRTELTAAILRRMWLAHGGQMPKTLIFVPSQQLVKTLAIHLEQSADTRELFPPRELSKPFRSALDNCAGDEDCRLLKRLASRGLAFHHAGMSTNLREAIEENAGELDVIVATETLTIGVNLPFHSVLLFTNLVNRGSGEEPLTRQAYKNYIGRAGRLGLSDGDGQSFLLVDKNSAALYQRDGSCEPVTSAFTHVREDREVVIAPYYLTLLLNLPSFTRSHLEKLQSTSLSSQCSDAGKFRFQTDLLLSDLTVSGMARALAAKRLFGQTYELTDSGKKLAPYALSLDTVYYMRSVFGKPVQDTDSPDQPWVHFMEHVTPQDIRSDRYLLDILYYLCLDPEILGSHSLDITTRPAGLSAIRNGLLRALQTLLDSGAAEVWSGSFIQSKFLGPYDQAENSDYKTLFRVLAMYFWVKGCSLGRIRQKMNLEPRSRAGQSREDDGDEDAPVLTSGDLERFSEVLSFHIEAASRLVPDYFQFRKLDADGIGESCRRAMYNLSVRVKYGMPTELVILANRQVHGLNRGQLLRVMEKAAEKGMQPIEYLFSAPDGELNGLMSPRQREDLIRSLEYVWRAETIHTLEDRLDRADVNDQWKNAVVDLHRNFSLAGLRNLLSLNAFGGLNPFFNCETLNDTASPDCKLWRFRDSQGVELGTVLLAHLPGVKHPTPKVLASLFPALLQPAMKVLLLDSLSEVDTGLAYPCTILQSQTLAILLGSLVVLHGQAPEHLYETLLDTRGVLQTVNSVGANYRTAEPPVQAPRFRLLMDCDQDAHAEDMKLVELLRQEHDLSGFELLPWGSALNTAVQRNELLPTVVLLNRDTIAAHESLFNFLYRQAHLYAFQRCQVILRSHEEHDQWFSRTKRQNGKVWDNSFDSAMPAVARTAGQKLDIIRRFLERCGKAPEYQVAVSWAHYDDNGRYTDSQLPQDHLSMICKVVSDLNGYFGEDLVLFDRNAKAGRLFHGSCDAILQHYEDAKVGVIFFSRYYCSNQWCKNELYRLQQGNKDLFYISLDGSTLPDVCWDACPQNDGEIHRLAEKIIGWPGQK